MNLVKSYFLKSSELISKLGIFEKDLNNFVDLLLEVKKKKKKF